MKTQTLLFLALLVTVWVGCSEQAAEPVIQNRDEVLAEQVQQHVAAGELPMLDRGILGIAAPEDFEGTTGGNPVLMSSLLPYSQALARQQGGAWPQLDQFFRQQITEAENSEYGWFMLQHIGNDALYYLLEAGGAVQDNSQALAYYTELLIRQQNGNAYLISKALHELKSYWDEDKLQEAARQTLQSRGLPSEAVLAELAQNAPTSVLDKQLLEKHQQGLEQLKLLAAGH